MALKRISFPDRASWLEGRAERGDGGDDMAIYRDLTGEQYGKLTVLSYVGKAADGHSEWRCKCECGNEVVLRSNNLQRAKSCGCISNALFDETSIGKKFGNLTIVSRAPKGNGKDQRWCCECDCGNTRVVNARDLFHHRVVSCGCAKRNYDRSYHRDSSGANNPSYKHGDSMRGKQARLYRVYHDMIRRCQDQHRADYKNYGGRGITVCDEWRESYPVFKEWALSHGYSDSLTIDRKDLNGDYCPENCRWISLEEQAANRRNNHFVTVGGERLTLIQACAKLGLPYGTIRSRTTRGWSDEEALHIPIGITRKDYYASTNSL